MTKKIFTTVALLSFLIIALTGFENLTARSFKKAPVITYKRTIPDAPKHTTTGIHVYENGRIRLIDKTSGTDSRNIFISKTRIRRLLNTIIRKHKFFSISMADVRAFQKTRSKIADAATTHITVWGRKGTHKLSIYNFFKDTKVSSDKMVRLRRIVRLLEKLRQETKNKQD